MSEKTKSQKQEAAHDLAFFVAEAKRLQRERGLSRRESYIWIKKQYPEAREAFKGEPLPL